MADAPQVVYAQPELQVDRSQEQPQPAYHHDISGWPSPAQSALPSKEADFQIREGDHPVAEQPKVLGVRRQRFWIICALVIFVVIATVGGSVGGVLAVQHAR